MNKKLRYEILKWSNTEQNKLHDSTDFAKYYYKSKDDVYLKEINTEVEHLISEGFLIEIAKTLENNIVFKITTTGISKLNDSKLNVIFNYAKNSIWTITIIGGLIVTILGGIFLHFILKVI